MSTIAEQLAAAPLTNSLKGSPGEAEFPKLGWAESRGSFTSEGWEPPGYGSVYLPTHSKGGTYYSTTKLTGGNGFSVLMAPTAAYGQIGGESYRSFSVWLFCPTPAGTKANGYQLRAQQEETSGQYDFVVYKFVENAETVVSASAGTMELNGGAFALCKLGGELFTYVKASAVASWAVLGTGHADSTFTEGYSAIDGAGSNPVLPNLTIGTLKSTAKKRRFLAATGVGGMR